MWHTFNIPTVIKLTDSEKFTNALQEFAQYYVHVLILTKRKGWTGKYLAWGQDVLIKLSEVWQYPE